MRSSSFEAEEWVYPCISSDGRIVEGVTSRDRGRGRGESDVNVVGFGVREASSLFELRRLIWELLLSNPRQGIHPRRLEVEPKSWVVDGERVTG